MLKVIHCAKEKQLVDMFTKVVKLTCLSS